MEFNDNKSENKITVHQKIVLLAKSCISVLSDSYKEISKAGKVEVIIFNTVLLINFYSRNHSIDEKLFQSILDELLIESTNYMVQFDSVEEVMEFIKNRIYFYAQEIDYFAEKENYLPGKLFTTFYVSPQIQNPESNFDIFELMKFQFALKNLINKVDVLSKAI